MKESEIIQKAYDMFVKEDYNLLQAFTFLYLEARKAEHDKSCQWLKANLHRYDESIGWTKEEFIENFRKETEK